MNSPIHFKVKASSLSPVDSAWNSYAIQSEIKTVIPPQFGGPGGGASPEDLYALSLGNCFLATFKVIASKSKLNYASIDVEVDLLVNPDENKKLVMKSAVLKIRLLGAENAERALRLLQKTPEHCMILNSVKTQLDFDYQVNE
jgi:organic hydroperoxide reductase OsmC/OhrA